MPNLTPRIRVEVYVPQNQVPFNGMALTVLTSGNPMNLVPTIQKEVSSIDPDLPIYRIRTMNEVMGESLQRRRLALILLAGFAGLALLLASIGIYGVMSYGVAQRKVEIGVRMALGAERVKVVRLVMLEATRITAVGLCLGLPSAVMVGRSLQSLLYEVQPVDPRTIMAVTVVSIVTALVAATLPAWRAARVDPMIALRHD